MGTWGTAQYRQSSPEAFSLSSQNPWSTGPVLPNWYAAFTLAQHEKRVVAHCEQRQIESFLPLYSVTRKWKNRCSPTLHLPLFPCYFFVRIPPQDRARVLQVPGVISLVSSGRQLLPLPEDYIDALREGLRTHMIEPHPNVEVGDVVRIKAGPFTGLEGVLERRKNGLRVVLRLELLARSISVELDAEEIEWIGPGPGRSFAARLSDSILASSTHRVAEI